EIGQRSRWRVRRGRTGNAGRGKPASRAGCDPSLGQHGGAANLAQLSRLSGRAQDRREIREIQHRRGQWPKIAVAHSRPRDAKGDPDWEDVILRCVTVEDKVASLDDLVAGKAGVVHRLAGGFAAVRLSEPPAAGRGVFS